MCRVVGRIKITRHDKIKRISSGHGLSKGVGQIASAVGHCSGVERRCGIIDDCDGYTIASTCVIVASDAGDIVSASARRDESAFGGAASIAWMRAVNPQALIEFGTGPQTTAVGHLDIGLVEIVPDRALGA